VSGPPATEGGTTRLLRTAGVAVVTSTALYLAVQTVSLLVGDAAEAGVRRYAVAAAFALAAVATGTMAVDLADRWLRGERITAFSQKMMRSLVFVTLLVALLLSFIFRGPSFFLPLMPALLIYLFGTWQRPVPRTAATRRPAATSAGRSRQRRGGRSGRCLDELLIPGSVLPGLDRDRCDHDAIRVIRESVQSRMGLEERQAQRGFRLPLDFDRRVGARQPQVRHAPRCDRGAADVLTQQFPTRRLLEPGQRLLGRGHALRIERRLDAAPA